MISLTATRARRFEFFSALALTALLVVMHFVLLLNRGPLWRDEISSLALASAPTLKQFWAGLALDPLPAFFPLLLRVWRGIVGDGDFSLRLLGFFIGLGSLGAFWWSARLTGRRTPIVALVSLGLCPTLFIWGDSLRGYGLGVGCVVVAFALFWKLIEAPSAWIFSATTLAAILSVQSIYSNALLIFSCGIGAAAVAARRGQWGRVGLVLLAGVIAALTLLPYVPLWRATAEWAGLAKIDYSLGSSAWMLGLALLGLHNFLLWLWFVLIVGAVVIALVRQRPGSGERDSALYALIASAGGFICTMAFFWFVGWGTNVWYYLPMLAVAAVGIDLICDFREAGRRVALARVAVPLLAVGLCLPAALRGTEVRASNIDQVAQVISKHATAGDLVVLWPSVDGITFKRYFRGDLAWTTIPEIQNFPAQPGDDVLAPFRRADGIQPTLERIDAALKAHHRVWIASTWPLRLSDGPVKTVPPLRAHDPRVLGNFLWGWGYLLANELQLHAHQMQVVALPHDQPVSIYERSTVMTFSGWNEEPLAAPLTAR